MKLGLQLGYWLKPPTPRRPRLMPNIDNTMFKSMTPATVSYTHLTLPTNREV